MGRLTAQEIDQEALKIKQEYAYMDNMPLEGWMWEFIRRSEEYRTAYAVIERKAKESQDLSDSDSDVLTKEIHSHLGTLLRLASYCAPGKSPLVNRHDVDSETWLCHRTLLPPHKPYGDLDSSPDGPGHSGKNYSSLGNKMIIPGTEPFVIREYGKFQDDIREWIQKRWEPMAKIAERDSDWEPLARYTLDFFSRMLSITFNVASPKNTIIIALSTQAKIDDVEKHLIPAIKPFLKKKPRTIRRDKWKHYLIVHDLLKDSDDLPYESVADIFTCAFPQDNLDKTWEPRTIENYHKQALYLIAGGYRKYLYD